MGKNGAVLTNASMDGAMLDEVTKMDDATLELLTKSVEQAKLSARWYYRILRVARTIADLNGGAETLCKADIAEALSYRRMMLNE